MEGHDWNGLDGPRHLPRVPTLALALTHYKLDEYPPSPLEWRRYGGYGHNYLAACQMSNLVDCCLNVTFPLVLGERFYNQLLYIQ